jgi:hypothetical protein
VLYQGEEIVLSPYNVRVVGAAPNPGSCQTKNFPTQSKAGSTPGFYITCLDQYGNQVYNCTSFSSWQLTGSGPSTFISQISSCDSTTGYYTAFYSANKTGNYTLKISLNNSPIQNSPSSVLIIPADLADSHSFASGPGFQGTQTFVAGTQTYVYIQAKDMYDNNLVQCTQDVSYWTISLQNTLGYRNQSFPAYNCSNGLYFALIQPTSAGNIKVIVSGLQSQVSNSPGAITVIPGGADWSNTWWYGKGTAVIGEPFTITVITEDQYNNVILTCNNSLPSDMNVTMTANFNPSLIYTFLSSNCSNGMYVFPGRVFYDGLYNLVITLFGQKINNISYTWPFTWGYAVTANTKLVLNATSVAGVDTVLWIQLVNQYGVSITNNEACWGPLSSPANWNLTITPAPAHPLYIEPCINGHLAVHYNSTKSGLNSITYFFNNTAIPMIYHTLILPSILDPKTLMIANVSTSPDTTGNFSLYAKDIFGNPETYISSDYFRVELTPSCVNTSVNCSSPNNTDHLQCVFTVEQGGQYCIRIIYQSQPYILNNSHIVVYGGSRCPGGCGSRGFCFVTPPALSNSTNTTTHNSTNSTNTTSGPAGSCNCYPDYTGVNCEYTVSKRYMKLGLGIGLIVGLSILFLIIGLLIGFFVIGRWRKMD